MYQVTNRAVSLWEWVETVVSESVRESLLRITFTAESVINAKLDEKTSVPIWDSSDTVKVLCLEDAVIITQ